MAENACSLLARVLRQRSFWRQRGQVLAGAVSALNQRGFEPVLPFHTAGTARALHSGTGQPSRCLILQILPGDPH